MGVETLIASAAIGSVAGGLSGMEKKKEAKRQAAIVQENANRQADIVEKEAEDLKTEQKSMYLASGIDLTGSPLLLLQSTLSEGRKQAQDIKEAGAVEARNLRRQGRNALISSIFSGGSQGLNIGQSFIK